MRLGRAEDALDAVRREERRLAEHLLAASDARREGGVAEPFRAAPAERAAEPRRHPVVRPRRRVAPEHGVDVLGAQRLHRQVRPERAAEDVAETARDGAAARLLRRVPGGRAAEKLGQREFPGGAEPLRIPSPPPRQRQFGERGVAARGVEQRKRVEGVEKRPRVEKRGERAPQTRFDSGD